MIERVPLMFQSGSEKAEHDGYRVPKSEKRKEKFGEKSEPERNPVKTALFGSKTHPARVI
jgi:hypothetical protein